MRQYVMEILSKALQVTSKKGSRIPGLRCEKLVSTDLGRMVGAGLMIATW